MDNDASGFAVLNISSYTLHMGLSMAALHYYENNVNHGEIFYRWPGAVHYTVIAQTAPKFSDGTRIKEILKASSLGVFCAGTAITTAVMCPPALPALSTSVSSLAYAAGKTAAVVAVEVTGEDVAAKQFVDVLVDVHEADLQARKMGCYGCGSGTWLVLHGGLQRDNEGGVKHVKLYLEKVESEYVLQNGTFTAESYRKFIPGKRQKFIKLLVILAEELGIVFPNEQKIH